MATDLDAGRQRAVLVAVQLPRVSDEAHRGSMRELRRLVETLGMTVVAELSQRRPNLHPGEVLGEGRLRELARLTGGPLPAAEEGTEPVPPAEKVADVVVVDHELTPMQVKNLAAATQAAVMDRAGVIVEIFHRHASSREARLQVEMARLRYVAPRFRQSAGGFDRQGGGVGAKGAGESQLELDKRRIRDRLAEIRREIAEIEGERQTRRARRSQANRVALVGYTNAGKSSWMRALTGSEVLVADKLFATLDTTVRALHPETRPKILISDTVGFIDKLPHDLVASFRSTLDEALEASLLVFVADASDPGFRAQLEVTRRVIAEIGAGALPSQLWLNKVDRLDAAERAALATEFPEARLVTTRDPACIAAVHDALVAWFNQDLPEAEILVPYDRAAAVGHIHEQATVLAETYEETGIRFRLRASVAVVDRIRAEISAPSPTARGA
jgi:GTP-binding protein HflX